MQILGSKACAIERVNGRRLRKNQGRSPMKNHDHAAIAKREIMLAHDEVGKKARGIDLNESF